MILNKMHQMFGAIFLLRHGFSAIPLCWECCAVLISFFCKRNGCWSGKWHPPLNTAAASLRCVSLPAGTHSYHGHGGFHTLDVEDPRIPRHQKGSCKKKTYRRDVGNGMCARKHVNMNALRKYKKMQTHREFAPR